MGRSFVEEAESSRGCVEAEEVGRSFVEEVERSCFEEMVEGRLVVLRLVCAEDWDSAGGLAANGEEVATAMERAAGTAGLPMVA